MSEGLGDAEGSAVGWDETEPEVSGDETSIFELPPARDVRHRHRAAAVNIAAILFIALVPQ